VVADNPLAEVSEPERQVPGLIVEGGSNQAIALPKSAGQQHRTLGEPAFPSRLIRPSNGLAEHLQNPNG
jgi:hypothetical protein